MASRGLLRFLIRRLLLAVPTLLGICVITFALIHLAPGEPVDSSQGSGPGLIGDRASARRIYFLDLPLFYNSAPGGAERRALELTRKLQEAPPSRLPGALRSIQSCGTTCLPELVTAWLESGPGQARERLRGALEDLRRRHPQLGAGAGDLRAWARQAQAALTPAALAAELARLGAGEDAPARLQARGTAALPALLPLILEGEGPARAAAAEAAGAIIGTDARFDQGAAALAFWQEWWYQHRRDHQRFGSWDRLHGRLTETQFGKWLGRLLTLRLGHSLHDGRPVRDKLMEALPVTLLLSFLAMALAYLAAVPLGVHAAVHRGKPLERVITFVLFVLYSLPAFWVAMMLILLFGGVGYLDWFPIYGLYSAGLEEASGWTYLVDRAHHLILPVICLSYGSLAVLSRFQRSAMLEVIRQDYIRTARAKGLSERAVLFRHALRNALLPIITLLGLQVPHLISGSVIIERIFNIPGMGLLTFQSFLSRDYPVIMAVAVLAAALTLVGLILADLFYALADPRIRIEGQP